MKSVIICEGNTDLVLLQYFLEKTYNWEYVNIKHYTDKMNRITEPNNQKWFSHSSGNSLCLISAGGCSKIPAILNKCLDYNSLGPLFPYDSIAVVCDRDEVETEAVFLTSLLSEFNRYHVQFDGEFVHNNWNISSYTNALQSQQSLNCLPLIIPFEDTGAIESFLLNALSQASEQSDPEMVDKRVIEQCIDFIDNIDCCGKYLTRRRDKTKAKFDSVFVVMTPAEAFSNRRNLLRSVPWEEFETIQIGFKHFSHFSH
ncbi:hypothetical protein [Paenibacillus sp. FSL R7-0179]|uniref:hypothetical protein n=1 Tax=Paenibacillus sp. FSL R7-0179 TaxID=2921672 RepID=UPI0030F9DEBA